MPESRAAGRAGLGPARVAELDAGGMLGAIAGLADQLECGYPAALAALHAAPPETAAPGGLLVCGMGGSAIGGDLVAAALPELKVPAVVVRGYALPAWAGSETLVAAVSYSGETAETLACAAQARERGCRLVCVASGGSLAAFAREHDLPLVTVPGGGQPRAAVGHLTAALLAVLAHAGLARDQADEIAAAAAELRHRDTELGPDADEAANPAKRLARRLHGRLAVVYGAGRTAALARRWKGQINENAKAPAFFNELPELNHNELMGWTSLPRVTGATAAVFLLDEQDDERLARRAALTAADLEALGARVEFVAARGDGRLARLFSVLQLGDYVSFYLALLYGVDPTPVGAIQAFKARLAAGGCAGD